MDQTHPIHQSPVHKNVQIKCSRRMHSTMKTNQNEKSVQKKTRTLELPNTRRMCSMIEFKVFYGVAVHRFAAGKRSLNMEFFFHIYSK